MPRFKKGNRYQWTPAEAKRQGRKGAQTVKKQAENTRTLHTGTSTVAKVTVTLRNGEKRTLTPRDGRERIIIKQDKGR